MIRIKATCQQKEVLTVSQVSRETQAMLKQNTSPMVVSLRKRRVRKHACGRWVENVM